MFHVFSVHSVAGIANKTVVFGSGGFFFSSSHPNAFLPFPFFVPKYGFSYYLKFQILSLCELIGFLQVKSQGLCQCD